MNNQEQEKAKRKARFLPVPAFSVLSFLAKHWQAFAIAGLIAGIVIYHQYRTYTISSLRADLEMCGKEREEIAQLLDKQNNRIEELVKKGRIQAAEFNALKTKIESSQNSLDDRINTILSEPRPQTCESAIEYLIRAKEELAWPN